MTNHMNKIWLQLQICFILGAEIKLLVWLVVQMTEGGVRSQACSDLANFSSECYL